MIVEDMVVRKVAVGYDSFLPSLNLVSRTDLGSPPVTSILIHGPSGAGKSVMAMDLAIKLATRGPTPITDLLLVTTEALPSEIVLQRAVLNVPSDSAIEFVLDYTKEPIREKSVVCWTGMLSKARLGEEYTDELGEIYGTTARRAVARGSHLGVMILDAVSPGTHNDRNNCDDVTKFCMMHGVSLIVVADGPTLYESFADVVIRLGRGSAYLSKNRFGPAPEYTHRFDITEGKGVVFR
jgi:hypothetical protein